MNGIIEARYRVTTPMFNGGADPARPELRAPSFKGVLRYWWRACAWSRSGGDLRGLHRQEANLFGSPETGQSRVLITLAVDPEPARLAARTVLSNKAGAVVGEGARYLGYGLMNAYYSKQTGAKAGELTRGCIQAPFEVTARLRCRGLGEPEVESVIEALTALGLLCGLGSRSRRGYGSLSLRSLYVGDNERKVPVTAPELGAAIRQLGSPTDGGPLPEYTALSGKRRHVLITGDGDDPLDLLDHLGGELVRFRSSGRNGRILGGREPAEKRFMDDHLLVERGTPKGAHPKRIAFGLPLNFGKKHHQKVRPVREDRRASPLLFHVHDCGGRPVGVVSFLPARFLPGDDPRVSVGGREVPQVAEEILYRPVEDFLDRLELLRGPAVRGEKVTL